jgi:hypothetical protein
MLISIQSVNADAFGMVFANQLESTDQYNLEMLCPQK